MKISVVGLGYVGVVCAACFSREGHTVMGVDTDNSKVEMINSGKAPIFEENLEEYIQQGIKNKTLQATIDLENAILNSELTFISVGTPSQKNGKLDLYYVKEIIKSIGEILQKKAEFHHIIMRSTVLPGTAQKEIIPLLEKTSQKKNGKDFGYAFNPEFLRESTAISDFYTPPFSVVGTSSQETFIMLQKLYSFLKIPLLRTTVAEAEMLKYACNLWHAAKVTFANEIGMICKNMDIDSHKVMDIFCKDKKLNISPYYLKPGFAFGGSCLPKDLKAILYQANKTDIKIPLLNSILLSNDYQIQRVFSDFIAPLNSKKVALLGLSFKSKTDDLRESPQLKLAELMIGKGYQLKIYDKDVWEAKNNGLNSQMWEKDLTHIASRLSDNLDNAIQTSDVIVIAKNSPEFKDLVQKYPTKNIVDLVRITEDSSNKKYAGLCW
jgi:GDP-mannose 6-dehydrogenase